MKEFADYILGIASVIRIFVLRPSQVIVLLYTENCLLGIAAWGERKNI